MRFVLTILIGIGFSLGCGGGTVSVECKQHADCNLGPGGSCDVNQMTGNKWCSYPDTACATTGRRWSDFDTGDGLSGTCVLDTTTAVDASPTPDGTPGTDAMTPDAMIPDAMVFDACTPATCEQLSAQCGTVSDDGCGQTLDCGICVLPLSCGAGGSTNQCAGSCIPGQWTSSPLGFAIAGSRSAMAIDSVGGLHYILYQQSPDRVDHGYRANDGSDWVWDTIQMSVTVTSLFKPSIVIDSNDGVHVAYDRGPNEGPTYAYLPSTGAAWQINGTLGNSTSSVCMAKDNSDGIHLAFGGITGNSLHYAYKPAAGAWTAPAVVSADGTVLPSNFCSISVDEQGEIHLANYVGTGSQFSLLDYISKPAGGVWTSERITQGGWLFAEAKKDNSMTTHIAWGSGDRLRYRFKTPTTPWQSQGIGSMDDYAREPSLVVDKSGTVHIVYVVDGVIHYAHGSFGSFSVQFVTASNDATSTSMQVDDAGGVHVAYVSNETTPRARYLYRCPN